MARVNKKDVLLNMVYSLGAAIVILGALFKINHLSLGPLSGSIILGIGLVVEAFIFVVFAFDTPRAEYDWEKVYPELDGEEGSGRRQNFAKKQDEFKDAELALSQKLDKMLEQAKLDAGIFEKLREGIESFSRAVEDINTSADLASVTNKYGSELQEATNKLNEMNNNLNNLNKVYGGMLNAMRNNQ